MQRLRINVIEKVAGTTIRTTLISSGATISPCVSTLRTGSETLASSVTATASGDGHYYAVHLLPSTPAWYVNEWIGVINANTYIERQFIRSRAPEVD